VARPELGVAEAEAITRVIESGWVTQGPRVAEFEAAVADVAGSAHGVAVSSCTAALHLALVVAGVGPGDEVVVPSMSFIATANAVRHAGAVPVFAEVEPDTFNLDLADVESRLTPRTTAILLVHQLGLPADLDGFGAFAAERDLVLVEDAACAIGSRYRGKPIGGHSDLVCFSFHPRKLVTTGDGGMILTRRADLAERLRRLRQHGMSVNDQVRNSATEVIREEYLEVAYNYRMTDIQAAMGVEQLRRLPNLLERRRKLASRYDTAFANHPVIRTPRVPDDVEWNVQSYAIRLDGWPAVARDELMGRLLAGGVASRPGVMTAHREPAYATDRVRLPVSEAASDSSLIVPLFASMTDSEVDDTIRLLLESVELVGSRS
jgi:dTDP-4-amino-4,6-dideoxygalactose transaminase